MDGKKEKKERKKSNMQLKEKDGKELSLHVLLAQPSIAIKFC